MTAPPTTAAIEGPDWSAKAAGWAELWAGLAQPAREIVVEATRIGPGVRLLDVGCGSGEFCRLAADRGAVVSGIDAAVGMIEIARRLAPGARLCVGAIERLPWPDGSFDVVTGFNAFQFAAGMVAALVEAKRVARSGGQVAICNWARPEDRQLFAVLSPLRARLAPAPPAPGPPTPAGPAIGEAGGLKELAGEAGLLPMRSGEVDVPYVVPDRTTLERALLVDAGLLDAPDCTGRDAVRQVVAEAAGPFRQPDGSYRFENKFRYLIAGT